VSNTAPSSGLPRRQTAVVACLHVDISEAQQECVLIGSDKATVLQKPLEVERKSNLFFGDGWWAIVLGSGATLITAGGVCEYDS